MTGEHELGGSSARFVSSGKPLPDPLAPASLDLRSFPWMPLEVNLRDSELAVRGTGDEFRAAMILMTEAWHQVPAGSLPKDEHLLAHLAGFGRDVSGFRTVSERALSGFIECSDGRLYHPEIVKKALDAHAQKQTQKRRTEAARQARKVRSSVNVSGDRDGDGQNGRYHHDAPDCEAIHTSADNVAPNGAAIRKNPVSIRSRTKGGEKVQQPISESTSKIPENWTPSEADILIARHAGMTDATVNSEALKFRLHNISKDERSANWSAAWGIRVERWKELGSVQAAPNHAEVNGPSSKINWERQLRFYKNTGTWPKGHGPEPGSRGCWVPRELLVERGLENGLQLRFAGKAARSSGNEALESSQC